MSDADKPSGGPGPIATSETVASPDVANAATEIRPRASAPDVTLPDRPGARIRERPSAPPARYVPGDEIARGGMGRVALATDTLLERVVAVKQALTLDAEMLRRFARETKITARLEHPSIVPVYDAGTDGDAPFYVMRRVSGRPLSELILASSALDARLALVPNLLAAAQAVAHAHSRGIVHRDIKPANILVGDFGETVVIDWGLAKVVGEPDDDDLVGVTAADSLRTRAGTVFGTPGFMSPGQLRGDPVGPAADVYALGASLYFVLAGRPPHLAKTGDAMMALAAEGPPEPLAKLVPGVPRELVTIVDTALAYGRTRYRDASELAEDLRRYTTGQLVASHHYSGWERLVRFVRRNRAAVAIAVIATVVIAIGATLFVRRVIEERDRADAEAREAAAAQRSERERADQLLLLRAKTLLDANPTEALAVLGELAAESPRLPEAHGIANEAISHGVARGIAGPAGPTTIVALDLSGTRMLQSMYDGTLHVWDLVAGKEIRSLKFTAASRGTWIGPKILINGLADPVLLDPDTGAIEKLPWPRLRVVNVSDDERLIIAQRDGDDELLLVDGERRALTPVWPGHKVRGMVVAGDGSWFAAHDDLELVVFARDGSVLLRRPGQLDFVAASKSRRLALLYGDKLGELEIATKQWTPIDTSKFHRVVTRFAYRGEELLIAMGSGHVLAFRDHRLFEIARPSLLSFSHALGDDQHVFVLGNHSLLLVSLQSVRTIRLPHETPMARVAARPGVRRFAVVGRGIILVYELDQFVPRLLPAPPSTTARFFDDDTLLMTDETEARMRWRDLKTGRETPVGGEMVSVKRELAFDPGSGTAVMELFLGDSSVMFGLRKNSSELTRIYEGAPITTFDVLPGGAPLYATGQHVWVREASTPREVATLASPARTLRALSEGLFVALSRGGELVRGRPGGALDKAQLVEPPPTARIVNGDLIPPAIDVAPDGSVFAAWGGTIWRWTDRLERWSEQSELVLDVRVVGDHLVVMLLGNRLLLIELATGKSYPPLAHGGQVGFGSTVDSIVIEIGGYYHLVDPHTRVVWKTPVGQTSGPPELSGRGQMLYRIIDHLYIWDVPRDSGPMKSRIARYTNAVISKEGRLAWPWE